MDLRETINKLRKDIRKLNQCINDLSGGGSTPTPFSVNSIPSDAAGNVNITTNDIPNNSGYLTSVPPTPVVTTTTNGLMSNADKIKLDAVEDPLWIGTYPTLAALQAVHPTGIPGNSAYVGQAGEDEVQYIWDSTDNQWVLGGAGVLTPVDIKNAYESNPDTNAFTDAEKIKLASFSNIDPYIDGYNTVTGLNNLPNDKGRILVNLSNTSNLTWSDTFTRDAFIRIQNGSTFLNITLPIGIINGVLYEHWTGTAITLAPNNIVEINIVVFDSLVKSFRWEVKP